MVHRGSREKTNDANENDKAKAFCLNRDGIDNCNDDVNTRDYDSGIDKDTGQDCGNDTDSITEDSHFITVDVDISIGSDGGCDQQSWR